MWGVSTHSLVLSAVELARTYDGIDIVNCASFELLLRQAQLLEFSYSERGPAPPPKGEDKAKGKGKGDGKYAGKASPSSSASSSPIDLPEKIALTAHPARPLLKLIPR
jgi:hypothetical protein